MTRTSLRPLWLCIPLILGGSLDARDLESFRMPVHFEENRGQFPSRVIFAAAVEGGTLHLERDRLLLIPASDCSDPVELRFPGSRTEPVLEAANELTMRSNYYRGSNPDGWISNVRSFERVRYRDLYPGVDLELYPHGSSVELDFIVQPGVDPDIIQMKWGGDVSPGPSGEDLIVAAGFSEIRFHAPLSYQTSDEGVRTVVSSGYRLEADGSFGVELDDHDPARVVVIDPVVTFASYFGREESDDVFAMETDAAGNVYLTGRTYTRLSLGTVTVRYTVDPYLIKLSPEMEIIYVTIFGGAEQNLEYPSSLVVSDDGTAYVAGLTSAPDFPVLRPVQSAYGGVPFDAFISGFGPDGALTYSTFLGGSWADGDGARLALAPSGEIWITFSTESTDIPLVKPLQQNILPRFDLYLAKLSPRGDRILFSTYLGGTANLPRIANERVHELLVDERGNPILVGVTFSPDFPMVRPIQGSNAGDWDVFVTKFAEDGSSILFSTFYGGSDAEMDGETGGVTSFTAALDAEGDIWFSGHTRSTDLPLVSPAFTTPGGLYLVRMKGDGTRLDFSTYLPPSSSRPGLRKLEISDDGSIFLAGSGFSDLPLTNPITAPESSGYLMKLTPQAEIIYATHLEGPGTLIALDPEGRLYAAGQTGELGLRLIDPFQASHNGGIDGFLTRIEDDPTSVIDGKRILPVVGSNPGAFGSYFRTSLQLHNPTDEEMSARFVYRPAGVDGSPSDPSFQLILGPRETRSLDDFLLTMGLEGIGSAELAEQRAAPVTVVRVFNDGGDQGNTGVSYPPLHEADRLKRGDVAYLIAPPDPQQARFNLGLRTLSEGVEISVTLRSADGTVRKVLDKSFGPDFFTQTTASDFLEAAVSANDSLEIEIREGSAFVYGTATDNRTQDPSLQLARPALSGEMQIIPVAGSNPGAFGSFFRTTLQLHNPFDEEIEGKIVFHPAGVSGTSSDPTLSYAIAPGETISWDDLLQAMGLTGSGSIDLTTTLGGRLPVSRIRIFNDAGEAGTTGLTLDAMSRMQVLSAGESGVLIAPSEAMNARFNIGLRTLSRGATITATVRSSSGDVVGVSTKTYPPTFFEQRSAGELIGMSVDSDDSVTFTIESGSAIIYGTSTDNLTNDPSLQLAVSAP